MGADKANEEDTRIVVDFDDEPGVVALNVKDDAIIGQDVSGRIGSLDGGGRGPRGLVGFVIPGSDILTCGERG